MQGVYKSGIGSLGSESHTKRLIAFLTVFTLLFSLLSLGCDNDDEVVIPKGYRGKWYSYVGGDGDLKLVCEISSDKIYFDYFPYYQYSDTDDFIGKSFKVVSIAEKSLYGESAIRFDAFVADPFLGKMDLYASLFIDTMGVLSPIKDKGYLRLWFSNKPYTNDLPTYSINFMLYRERGNAR